MFLKVSEPRDPETSAKGVARKGRDHSGWSEAELKWTQTEGGAGHKVGMRVRVLGSSEEPSRKSCQQLIILRYNQLLQPLVPDPLRKRRDGSLGDLGL